MNPTFDGVSADEWMNGLKAMHDNNIKHILTTLAYFGIPQSFLDVGCGDGTAVEAARKLGCEAFGVDQLVQPDWPDYYFHQNLVDAFRLPKKVDMIYTLEVAEHLHESAHATFLDTLNENLADGGYLIFTAALPGQDGTGHVATRPPIYWRRELTDRGLTFSRLDTVNLGLLWSHVQSPFDHLAANLQVFVK